MALSLSDVTQRAEEAKLKSPGEIAPVLFRYVRGGLVVMG